MTVCPYFEAGLEDLDPTCSAAETVTQWLVELGSVGLDNDSPSSSLSRDCVLFNHVSFALLGQGPTRGGPFCVSSSKNKQVAQLIGVSCLVTKLYLATTSVAIGPVREDRACNAVHFTASSLVKVGCSMSSGVDFSYSHSAEEAEDMSDEGFVDDTGDVEQEMGAEPRVPTQADQEAHSPPAESQARSRRSRSPARFSWSQWPDGRPRKHRGGRKQREAKEARLRQEG
eukprot:1028735-Amphidinium_carterae.1